MNTLDRMVTIKMWNTRKKKLIEDEILEQLRNNKSVSSYKISHDNSIVIVKDVRDREFPIAIHDIYDREKIVLMTAKEREEYTSTIIRASVESGFMDKTFH